MYAHRKVQKVISKYNKKFNYVSENDKPISNPKILEYIKSLKIPPGYHDVVINLNKNAKILVKARDDRGRRQYIYNKAWIAKQTKAKNCKMIAFGKMLPHILSDINKNLASPGISRNKVIATVLAIIMSCNFRIGNNVFKNTNESYGITTISRRHVKFQPRGVLIDFRGKRGVQNTCLIKDPRLKRVIKQIYETGDKKNADLFNYKDTKGHLESVNSNDINEYLKKYGDFTSKDFRTWVANHDYIDEVMDGHRGDMTLTERKKNSREAIKTVAHNLHHTPAICKKNYIDDGLIEMYTENPTKFDELVAKNYKKGGAGNAFIKYLGSYCN